MFMFVVFISFNSGSLFTVDSFHQCLPYLPGESVVEYRCRIFDTLVALPQSCPLIHGGRSASGGAHQPEITKLDEATARACKANSGPTECLCQAIRAHKCRPRTLVGPKEGEQEECVLLVQHGVHFLDGEKGSMLAEAILTSLRVLPSG